MAISEFEIDISAGHILNRTRRSKNSNIYANNPGIASIWDDELLRRENLSIIEVISIVIFIVFNLFILDILVLELPVGCNGFTR